MAPLSAENGFENGADGRPGRVESPPQIYWSLGQVYLLSGKLDRALEAFEAGLRLDPLHDGLREALRRYDRRRVPPLPLFERSHRLNHWLGRARRFIRRSRS